MERGFFFKEVFGHMKQERSSLFPNLNRLTSFGKNNGSTDRLSFLLVYRLIVSKENYVRVGKMTKNRWERKEGVPNGTKLQVMNFLREGFLFLLWIPSIHDTSCLRHNVFEKLRRRGLVSVNLTMNFTIKIYLCITNVNNSWHPVW